jgi:hypothetical protein
MFQGPSTGLPPGYDPTLSMFIAFGMMFLIMLIRVLRGMPQRRVRIETMWIGPVIMLALAYYLLRIFPPPASPLVYAILAVATVVGFGVGWLRGRMVKITVNVENHQLMSQLSPWGMLVLLGIVAARMGLRYVITDHMAEWHISASALTDGFILFYVGMIIGRRIEILIRCLRLLREAREAKAKGEAVPETVTEDHA